MLYVSQKQRSCSHFVLIHIHYSVDDQSFLPQYFQPKTLYITTSFSLLYFYDYKPYKETWLQGSSWEQLDGVPNLMGGGILANMPTGRHPLGNNPQEIIERSILYGSHITAIRPSRHYATDYTQAFIMCCFKKMRENPCKTLHFPS